MAEQKETEIDGLEDFLANKLPQCLEKCNKYIDQLIVDGHKAVTPHILNASDNVSKEQLSNVKCLWCFIPIK